jgi:hypothetical protein
MVNEMRMVAIPSRILVLEPEAEDKGQPGRHAGSARRMEGEG